MGRMGPIGPKPASGGRWPAASGRPAGGGRRVFEVWYTKPTQLMGNNNVFRNCASPHAINIHTPEN